MDIRSEVADNAPDQVEITPDGGIPADSGGRGVRVLYELTEDEAPAGLNRADLVPGVYWFCSYCGGGNDYPPETTTNRAYGK